MTAYPPVLLTIAGSDSGAGAGIQADLKTFSAWGTYGTTVITAVTSQNTQAVTDVHVLPMPMVEAQCNAVLADMPVAGIKVGMLGTAQIVRGVTDILKEWSAENPDAPTILDPVMVATSGDRLLDDDAVKAMRDALPYVGLITPNRDEAAVLLGCEPATSVEELYAQARRLSDLGAPRVLVKGGHLEGDAVDVLLLADGTEHLMRSPRVETRNTHGTGCTLSAAILAARLRHDEWHLAVAAAKGWLTTALKHADELRVGEGHGPVHHFHAMW